ncbi:ribosome small subunit-dependent GTPase A [Chryseolinea sp. T2]|uniref:ribosome small subunit-dependent GTPase A n=1 Tax=Chryseolinea sp. T2 TaxID=3129255 RepID=UPI0030778EE6
MQLLEQYGWNSFFQSYKDSRPDHNTLIGRVISIKGFKYELVTSEGFHECELAGKLLFGASPEELPKVGDWVWYLPYDVQGYIVDVLPRRTELSRKAPGAKSERQVLAVNLDAALVVQGLDRDFNLMRLDRYLVQLAACSIPTIVVLNKADLVDDTSPYLNDIQKLHRNVAVHFCSTFDQRGVSELFDLLGQAKTYALIGSSGVGKSSLLNAWNSTVVQATGSLGVGTQKGKHTTTTRDLFMLSNGSLVIDTPGMREFGVTMEAGTDENVFPVIAELSQKCRYSDCLHQGEEGCAVLQALDDGSLESVVYDSYIKLLKEQRRFHVNAINKKRMEKQFGKMTREASNHRKKYKY